MRKATRGTPQRNGQHNGYPLCCSLRYYESSCWTNLFGHKSRFGYNIQRYLNAEDMLEKEKLDAVFVSTPDFWHSPHSVMAMEAGCAVYCEKMMSDTLEGARRIVAARAIT